MANEGKDVVINILCLELKVWGVSYACQSVGKRKRQVFLGERRRKNYQQK
jgi:hypothetical protein